MPVFWPGVSLWTQMPMRYGTRARSRKDLTLSRTETPRSIGSGRRAGGNTTWRGDERKKHGEDVAIFFYFFFFFFFFFFFLVWVINFFFLCFFFPQAPGSPI